MLVEPKQEIAFSELSTGEKKRPRFSICLLYYNGLELTTDRLWEIEQHLAHRDDVEFILIDNGSTDGRLEPLVRKIANTYPNKFFMVKMATNQGFGGGFNLGIEAAAWGEVLILMSNDVEIKGDFLEKSGENIYNQCKAGNLVCHRKLSGNTGWNKFGAKTIPYAEGYFLSIDREKWEKIGGFDIQFNPHDYEDLDLSMSVMTNCGERPMEDWHIVEMRWLEIKHLIAGTIGYNPDREAITIRNRKRFAEKWDLMNIPERP